MAFIVIDYATYLVYMNVNMISPSTGLLFSNVSVGLLLCLGNWYLYLRLPSTSLLQGLVEEILQRVGNLSLPNSLLLTDSLIASFVVRVSRGWHISTSILTWNLNTGITILFLFLRIWNCIKGFFFFVTKSEMSIYIGVNECVWKFSWDWLLVSA